MNTKQEIDDFKSNEAPNEFDLKSDKIAQKRVWDWDQCKTAKAPWLLLGTDFVLNCSV